MLLKNALLGGALTALSTATFAAQGSGQAEISLEDLRAKCTAILANPQMVKPTITVSCDQHRYEWRQCDSQINLDASRTVNSILSMKDWQVTQGDNFPSQTAGACVKFVKYHLYTRAVQDTMTCEDLLANVQTKGQLTAHCDAAVTQQQAADPGLVVDQGPTGDVINTCQGQQGQQGQQGVRGSVNNPCPGETTQGGQGGQGG